MNLYGSICLTDIPRELFRKADNGKVYLNLRIYERKEIGKFGHTHVASCAPRKDEQKEGVNYFCGDFKVSEPQQYAPPTPEQVATIPPAEPSDLPF